MRSSIAILLSAAALGLAQGCQQAPSGKNVGNPIATPGLNQIVPAGTPFSITWTPTTPGPVSLVLLRGPSTNVLPIACISESIPNSGTFVWTPPISLVPDVTHYGLQIIQSGSGDYQYSTQFGISNPAYHVHPSIPLKHPHTTTTEAHTHTKAKHTVTTTGTPPKTKVHKHEHKLKVTSVPVSAISQLSDGQPQIPTSVTNATTHTHIVSTLHLNITSLPTIVVPSATGIPSPKHHNTSSVHLTVPSTLKNKTHSATQKPTSTGNVSVSVSTGSVPPSSATTAPTTSAPATGAAARMVAGGLFAGLGALAALVL